MTACHQVRCGYRGGAARAGGGAPGAAGEAADTSIANETVTMRTSLKKGELNDRDSGSAAAQLSLSRALELRPWSPRATANALLLAYRSTTAFAQRVLQAKTSLPIPSWVYPVVKYAPYAH